MQTTFRGLGRVLLEQRLQRSDQICSELASLAKQTLSIWVLGVLIRNPHMTRLLEVASVVLNETQDTTLLDELNVNRGRWRWEEVLQAGQRWCLLCCCQILEVHVENKHERSGQEPIECKLVLRSTLLLDFSDVVVTQLSLCLLVF